MSSSFPALAVVPIRYSRSRLTEQDERSIDAYAAANVYAAAGVPFTVSEPRLDEARRVDDEPTNLGALGGAIATIVAEARAERRPVLMTGGDCNHITGVVGGLQDAHGPDARIGLVWFDAHGDFNTPRTTLSGMLGGMPVAVAAGLCFPQWRAGSHIAAPIPTDRIVLVDVRNLDAPEEQLIRATDAVIAAPATGFPGADLAESIAALAAKVDYIYLHIDSDILDERYVPNHGTKEPNGPDMQQVLDAVEKVMATGKVAAYAVVSVYGTGPGSEVCVPSGVALIEGGLRRWAQHGSA